MSQRSRGPQPGATATAEITVSNGDLASAFGPDRKFHAFEVSAEDEAGEIGRGTHRRAIVQAARLEGSAARRHTG